MKKYDNKINEVFDLMEELDKPNDLNIRRNLKRQLVKKQSQARTLDAKK